MAGPSEGARALARRHGVPDGLADAARDDLAILGLVLDEFARPGPYELTLEDAAAQAGVDPVATRRVWRALGFADPAPGEAVATADDVAVLRVAFEQVENLIGIERLVRQTRVVSAAVARIAELWADELREALDAGAPVAEIGERFLAAFDLDRLTYLIGYVHRHQVQTALRRELAVRAAQPSGAAPRVVGFADLVDFTVRTTELSGRELALLVERFEALAFDTVAQHGGRVVKTIGDEVMFVGDDVATVVSLAKALASRHGHPDVPPLRVGLDVGPVVSFEGDVFGTPVNRAARIVAQAAPGCVAASGAVRRAHPDGGRWPSLGVRALKGIGGIELFEVV